MSHTPSPPARSPVGPSPIPLVPLPASGPEVPAGVLYGFVCCAGVLWFELPPMGASLVGSSHCETPVLIWTSVVTSQYMRGYGMLMNHEYRGRTVVLSRSVSVSCVAGHVDQGGAASAVPCANPRETYVLSHWAIHPAGSLGRLGSVGPESGETGGIGGVGTAILARWRWDAGLRVRDQGEARGRAEEKAIVGVETSRRGCQDIAVERLYVW